MNNNELKNYLESIYLKYNKNKFILTDPLSMLYQYKSDIDIEIVGLITSSLSYGRVLQILKAINIVLNILGKSPVNYLNKNNHKQITDDFKFLKYRFTKGKDIANLLIGIKYAIQEYGSIQNLFLENYEKNNNFIRTLELFVENLLNYSDTKSNYLIPSPKNGSACKRLFLFLRWMVRKDNIDLGIWNKVDSADLYLPLDTHMYQVAKKLNFTNRASANLKTVIEITEHFKSINKDDPTKYDFALTRAGIISTNNFNLN